MQKIFFQSTLSIMLGFILLFNSQLLAQDNIKKDVTKKLKQIKGNVTKVTIVSDGELVEFQNDEAEELVKRMKSSNKKIQVLSDRDFTSSHVGMEKFCDDEDGLPKVVRKKVKIEDNDGNRKVTIISNLEGEETTEVLEGDEAKKYIEDLEEKKGSIFFLDDCLEEEFDLIELESEDDIILLETDDDETIKVKVGAKPKSAKKYVIKKKIKKMEDD